MGEKLVWPRGILVPMAILIELLHFFQWSHLLSRKGNSFLVYGFHFVYFNIFPVTFTHKEISLFVLTAQRENS